MINFDLMSKNIQVVPLKDNTLVISDINLEKEEITYSLWSGEKMIKKYKTTEYEIDEQNNFVAFDGIMLVLEYFNELLRQRL
jgi:hypothetical protein